MRDIPANETRKYPRRKFITGASILAAAAVKTYFAPSHAHAEKLPEAIDLTPAPVVNYLKKMTEDPPNIGGNDNFHVKLSEGLGWVTYEFSEGGPTFGQNLINRVRDEIIPRLKKEEREPTVWEKMMLDSKNSSNDPEKAAEYFSLNFLSPDQSKISPEEALSSNKVIGTIATREDASQIGKPYLVWTVQAPNAEPKFVGVVLNVDNSGNWDLHQNWPYSFGNWKNYGANKTGLQWIADASYNLKKMLVPEDDRQKMNQNSLEKRITGMGQPGVIILSTEKYQQIIDNESN